MMSRDTCYKKFSAMVEAGMNVSEITTSNFGRTLLIDYRPYLRALPLCHQKTLTKNGLNFQTGFYLGKDIRHLDRVLESAHHIGELRQSIIAEAKKELLYHVFCGMVVYDHTPTGRAIEVYPDGVFLRGPDNRSYRYDPSGLFYPDSSTMFLPEIQDLLQADLAAYRMLKGPLDKELFGCYVPYDASF